MHRNKPRTDKIPQLVQGVSVRDAVDGGVDGEEEEEDVGDVASAGGEAGDHFAAGEGLDEDEVGHYGEDVVVRGEGGEPVHGEVVRPDEEDHDVDGEDPDH